MGPNHRTTDYVIMVLVESIRQASISPWSLDSY